MTVKTSLHPQLSVSRGPLTNRLDVCRDWSPLLFLPWEEALWSTGFRRPKSPYGRVCYLYLVCDVHTKNLDRCSENLVCVQCAAPISRKGFVSRLRRRYEKKEGKSGRWQDQGGSSGQGDLSLRKPLQLKTRKIPLSLPVLRAKIRLAAKKQPGISVELSFEKKEKLERLKKSLRTSRIQEQRGTVFHFN